MGHTPGPWERSFNGSEGWWVYAKTRDEIHPHITHIINIAQCVGPKDRLNSFLIAAAPDLLESLENLLDDVRKEGATEIPSGTIREAYEAIKKARGEE